MSHRKLGLNCYWTLAWSMLLALMGRAHGRVVVTSLGPVSGLVVTGADVEVFRGLPYASAARFSPPEAATPWFRVRPATAFGPACPQSLPEAADRGMQHLQAASASLRLQSEDCLTLNVYTPLHASARSRHSVMVFVDGEGFQWGGGHLYDATGLVSKGRIVVVTLNYRLGVLGFLAVGRHRNLGLQDLMAALRWVKENIHAFGGEPTAVTLAGHGSGAACVHWLMVSTSLPHGSLFHRVILMSGSARSLVANPQEVVKTAAQHLNCPLDHRLMHCLRDRPLEALLSVPVAHSTFSIPFGPVEDGVIIVNSKNNVQGKLHNKRLVHHHRRSSHVETYLSRHPVKYDLLFGLVKAEALFYFSDYDLLFGIESDRKICLLEAFVNETYRYHTAEILATLVNEYTSWERPIQHPANILQETEEALSDGLVVAPLVRAMELHSGGGYMYLFAHQTRASDISKKHGSVHGEELSYLFPGSSFLARNFTKPEAHLSETFIAYVANFVKTGDPNKADDLRYRPKHRRRSHRATWLPYDKIHKRFMMLDTRSKMKDHYRAHRLSFWLNLVPQLQHGSEDNQLENSVS